jgi:hypothetical protein
MKQKFDRELDAGRRGRFPPNLCQSSFDVNSKRFKHNNCDLFSGDEVLRSLFHSIPSRGTLEKRIPGFFLLADDLLDAEHNRQCASSGGSNAINSVSERSADEELDRA